ncbi:MAG: helix-turn-helix domain-containing protein [Saprospiraceae bacterium]
MNCLLVSSILLLVFTSDLLGQEILSIPYTSQELNPKELQPSDAYGTSLSFAVAKRDEAGSPNLVTMYFAWDENYLYGQAQVKDAELIKLKSGNDHPNLNLNDAIEFFIDPLLDSKGRMDINDYQIIFSVGGDVAVLKGDKAKLALPDERAPKEIGTATIAIHHEVFVQGTINQTQDIDSGFIIQFSIPWAALGVMPKSGHQFKMDVCLDDMDEMLNLDTMREQSYLRGFSYSNWVGDNDFSYPDRWRKATLIGRPNLIDGYLKHNANQATYWIIAFVIGSAIVIGFQYYRIRQLAMVPVKSKIQQSPLLHFVEQEGIEPNNLVDPVFETLRDFVLKNLDRDLSPTDLAQQLHISLRQLQRIFQEQMESTPSRFVLLIKLEQAALLLQNRSANISQVGYELGFNDAAYFSRVFKKYQGISPSAYKERFK